MKDETIVFIQLIKSLNFIIWFIIGIFILYTIALS
jgi:hypothetical protein